MIEDLRWIDLEVDEGWGRGWTIKRVLQAYDGHVWFTVPLVKDSPPASIEHPE